MQWLSSISFADGSPRSFSFSIFVVGRILASFRWLYTLVRGRALARANPGKNPVLRSSRRILSLFAFQQ